MKKHIIFLNVLLLAALAGFSSCEVIGGIFKTGVWVGVLIVVVLIVIVAALFGRSGK
ncbi:MAG: phosphatidate cytidylyltransferase [Chitinophagaceae bacterium]|uniref:Phosphatidate cytidylyltransferase n=1 Tax=Rurimicrobium arvi TaxID=2049916 RepID=A0ABP8MDZ3_9BACT